MKKLLLIAVASTAFLSFNSFAENELNSLTDSPSLSMENQWYSKLNVGSIIFNKQKDKATELKMKSNGGFAFELGLGYYIMDRLRTDLTIGSVLDSRLKKSITETNVNGDTLNTSIQHKPTIISALLSGYIDFVDLSILKVFAGGGVGVATLKEKIIYRQIKTINGAVTANNLPDVNTRSKTNFAYQLSLGISFEVAPGMNAELVYNLRDYGKTKTKKVDGENEGGTRYRGNNLMAGLRFDM